MTYLAVPIAVEEVSAVEELIKAACSAGGEMLELRSDYLAKLNAQSVKKLIKQAKATKLPIIVTCRDKAQGGAGHWPLDLRIDILIEAINAGADIIDCEYDNFIIGDVQRKLKHALTEHPKARLILSAHNFDGPFDNLSALYRNILTACPEAIPKLVYKAGHINDCFEAFDLLSQSEPDAIVLCMGRAGLISRVLAKKLGAFLTFASVNDENATAPGQITARTLKSLYRWDAIDSDTELFGVIGNPVAHSLSPAIFNACFEARKINALYLPILVEGQKEQFNDFMDNIISRATLQQGSFNGFSVTMPHKAHALDYVEKAGEFIEPLAADIGAVNTLKIGIGGRVSGYNSDYSGAMDALVSTLGISRHDLHSVDIAVAGAGGVGRAVVAGLADVGAKITIYNRTLEKARALAEEFGCKYAPLKSACEMNAKVLINCTSIGMYPNVNAMAVPKECLKPDMAVFDTVYNPLQTQLLRQAAKVGAKTVSGAEMFIRQAMAQFKLFIGTEADEEVMRKTVFDCLS